MCLIALNMSECFFIGETLLLIFDDRYNPFSLSYPASNSPLVILCTSVTANINVKEAYIPISSDLYTLSLFVVE